MIQAADLVSAKFYCFEMSQKSLNWKSIIWREMQYCQDPDYAKHLYLAVAGDYFGWLRKLIHRWHARPLAAKVEAALYHLSQVEWSGQHAWGAHLRRLERTKDENIPLETLIDELDHYHWLRRFIARHALLYRGGEAVETLQVLANDGSAGTQSTVIWLLESICADTSDRLAQEPEGWICLQCFTGCQVYRLPDKPILTYYGCRNCRRSWGLAYASQGVVSVLDSGQAEKYSQQNGLLRVNWLQYQAMFDFDRVEIIQARDEEVERFAIQVGNDTDPARIPHYAKMTCSLAPGCHLSRNTQRILKNMFGVVDRIA